MLPARSSRPRRPPDTARRITQRLPLNSRRSYRRSSDSSRLEGGRMLRLLHFADLHLDRAFGGQSYVGCDGSQRRTLLRAALQWAVDLALEREADAVTIAGDL